ncbi:AraC family transcriptional regulator [Bradyrhizobium sp. CCBAU 51765]|uniref:AraC family transcriptional regulator n=1 Tax=Bradyrhizobium sp. CCBAU 51765 TaxID=1325102 RepID=UPI001886DD0F|nr:AraC family transcriptional regulator [Bradyrhizobium sp. CCBAU 51765]QOZ07928.1 AraC family transcriptional regulator [Bradyrhizobium sp. CCBAU 51765]
MPGAETDELLKAMVPLLRIRPVIDDSCRFGGTWESLHAPNGRGWAQFHMVTRGSCLVERPGLGPQRLDAGDILLLPHGDSHAVRSQANGVATRISSEIRNGIRQRRTVDARADTEFLCGRFLFEMSDENPLIAALPDEIVVRTAGEPLLERFRRLLIDIRDELDAGRVGSQMVAADLARALFVMMLRDHLADEGSGNGTVSLLRDRATARVVLAILNDLARDWTLDEMAAVAVSSRATLVRAFRKHAGIAPMTFLSDLRLTIARKRLAGTTDPIAKIAGDVGYASESALSKAIMRRYGLRPGALRMAEPGP